MHRMTDFQLDTRQQCDLLLQEEILILKLLGTWNACFILDDDDGDCWVVKEGRAFFLPFLKRKNYEMLNYRCHHRTRECDYDVSEIYSTVE